MAKKWRKIVALAAAAVMVGSVAGLAACGDEQPYEIEKRARTGWKDEKVYTYKSYTGQFPAVTSDMATSDQADIDLIGYINGSFFEFDYEYDANGEIVPGGFTVKYSGATALEDVTDEYLGQYGITEDDVAEGGHAWKITLRNDLKWNDGTPITAHDFEFTMQQQLSPNYLFEQASNYYSGNYIIHNAQNYVYQGQSDYFDNNGMLGYTVNDLEKGANGVYTLGGEDCYIPLNETLSWLGGTLTQAIAAYAGTMLDKASYDKLAALANEDGQVPVTDESLGYLEDMITTYPAWGESYENVVCYMYAYYTYPELEYDGNVGFFAESDTELVLVIDNTIYPVDADGSLNYGAAYYLSSFPLVKRDMWTELEDQTTKPWSNAYLTPSAETPSWGPYTLTYFQTDSLYRLERNTNWYGYGMERYNDQYQTDVVEVSYIPEWNTAWQAFQRGEIDGVSIDTTIIDQYRTSSQAYFTPETWTFSLFLQSSEEVYEEKENIMLKYDSFRQALSLALNRDDYCAVNQPSSLAALGYLNDMYYYDVENGGVYRDTVQANEALLRAYGATENADGTWTVGSTTYDDTYEAVDALTGYNLDLARELMQEAYEEAVAAGDYTDGDPIVLTLGVQEQTANAERNRAYLEDAFNAALEGTPMEDKLTIQFYTTTDNWDAEFKNGDYDICFSAWGSAAFDPFYLLGATQIWDANRFQQGWDPSAVTVTLDLEALGLTYDELTDTQKRAANEEAGTLTMNLVDWDDALQGLGENAYGFNFSNADIEVKLEILSAEETAILEAYWSIPVYGSYAANLMSYKCDYISYEYNTFMGYGGVQYMSYNFDDTEWETFIAENGDNGILRYDFAAE